MIQSMNTLPTRDYSLSLRERGTVTAKAFALLFTSALLAACGDGVEVTDLGKLEKPAEHEQAVATVQTPAPVERQVVVPDEVQKKFAAVTLSMKRRPDAKEQRLTLPLGTTQTSGGLTVTARDYLPAFVMQAATITSEGVEESNPALWVEVREGEHVLFIGWLFRDYPELNPPQDPAFAIQLVEAVSSPK